MKLTIYVHVVRKPKLNEITSTPSRQSVGRHRQQFVCSCLFVTNSATCSALLILLHSITVTILLTNTHYGTPHYTYKETTRVGTLIVATIYLQLIQNRYMFRSFTALQCSHQHCVQPVVSYVEVVGYL